jgi:hypothetical protein
MWCPVPSEDFAVMIIVVIIGPIGRIILKEWILAESQTAF